MNFLIYVDGSQVPRQVISGLRIEVVEIGPEGVDLRGCIHFDRDGIVVTTTLDGEELLLAGQPYEATFVTEPICTECSGIVYTIDPEADGHGYICEECHLLFCAEHYKPGEDPGCVRHGQAAAAELDEDEPGEFYEEDDDDVPHIVGEGSSCRACGGEFAITYEHQPHLKLLYCPFCGSDDLEDTTTYDIAEEDPEEEEEDPEEDV